MTHSRFIHATLRHFENRLFELSTSLMMIGLAVHVTAWPKSIGSSAFHFLLNIMSPASIVMLFWIGGLLRLAALIANGSWPVYGPKMRACGALMGASIWAQMGTALVLHRVHTELPPPDITVYFALASVELIAMCRALVDNGSSRFR